MLQVNVARLHDDNREALSLAWIAGREGGTTVRREAAAAASLIGHLNLTHPNSIQIIGAYEAGTVAGHVDRLFESHPSAVIVADGVAPPQALVEAAAHTHTPLFTSPLPAPRVIEVLARYLAKALAETTERHGVFMDVLGLGVLITGESGVGKSELGLELISRGHGLVADDVVEISRIAANTLDGRCPPMLRDFLEVRGLGLLNIRTIFGETAVRPKMKLKLIAHLEKPRPEGRDAGELLPLADLWEDILGVTVRKGMIPVASGRNLAVLVKPAVRPHILKLRSRGVDCRVLYLEANSPTLLRRFSETRRSHPLASSGLTLSEAIERERTLLAGVAALAQRIDTSELQPRVLQNWIRELLALDAGSLTLLFESFAYRDGIPLDADWVLDCRMLPNPHYDPQLRPFTGRDSAVAECLGRDAAVQRWLEDVRALDRGVAAQV